jgi:hypothetical protein
MRDNTKGIRDAIKAIYLAEDRPKSKIMGMPASGKKIMIFMISARVSFSNM